MKKNYDMILIALAGIGALASLVVLIICVNALISYGATSLRIWGIVGTVIAFVVCMALIGMLVYYYRQHQMTAKDGEKSVLDE